MLERVIYAVVWGVIAALVCYLIGVVLALIPVVAPVGHALQAFAWLVGLLAGLYYFVSGRTTLLR